MNGDMLNPRGTEDEGFPLASSPEDQLRFIANYAALAPSPFNTQPWKFRITNRTLEIHPDMSRWLPLMDPSGHDLAMACGAAAANASVACNHFGLKTSIEKNTGAGLGPEWALRVVIQGERRQKTFDALLFYAIRRRHTVRKSFTRRSIAPDFMDEIKVSLGVEGVTATEVGSSAQRKTIADLRSELMHDLFENKARTAEIRKWLGSMDPQRKDGEPAHASGIDQLMYYWLSLTGGEEAVAKEAELRHRTRILECPRILVISTPGDQLAHWLDAGIAMENALLRACSPGIQAAYFGQLTYSEATRQRTRKLLGLEGVPQMVLCLGFADSSPSTPRRPLAEMMMA